MHKIYAIAAGILLAISLSAYAQSTPKQGNGAAGHSLTEATQRQAQASADTHPAQSAAFPASPIQTDNQSAGSQKGKYETDNREERNLKATERSADAAVDQAEYAKWTLGISIAGTVGLFATIIYTRRSFTLAKQAADAATTANQLSMDKDRPWVGCAGVLYLSPSTETALPTGLVIVVKNFGVRPARTTVRVVIRPIYREDEITFYYDTNQPAEGVVVSTSIIFTTGDTKIHAPLAGLDFYENTILNGTNICVLQMLIAYGDVVTGLTYQTRVSMYRREDGVWDLTNNHNEST
ncbi:hypothetical protein [Rhodoferax sp. WC2427]|uniref:hypothetical protein n=1 Tax=Rhodoferax sp. WC2427 TaxID=3234144 RepID=UPI003465AB39